MNYCCCIVRESSISMPKKTIKAKSIRRGGTTLLIVDAQNDFHPGEGNTLSVPKADEDTARVANLIRASLEEGSEKINRIVATLDSHHKLHIAHPTFWVDRDGNNPAPFTMIPSSDIENGKWRPRGDLKLPIDEQLIDFNIMEESGGVKDKIAFDREGNLDLLSYCIQYSKALEKSGRFHLVIWPEHCLIGTRGHCLVESLHNSISAWSGKTGHSAEYVMKGQNLLTEMYSALRAEVPISTDTRFNWKLFESLNKSSKIIVVGQALSHCVNNTVRDLLDNMTREERGKVYLLRDCSSSVPGFEAAANDFVEYVKQSGANVCAASDIF